MRASSSRGLKGFDQIVVGAHLDADDALGLFAACAEHQHWQVRFGAQVAAQRQPVGVRQHQVEHDQIDGMALKGLPHLAPIPCGDGVKTIARQIIHQQAADFRVIVDDENAVGVVHGL